MDSNCVKEKTHPSPHTVSTDTHTHTHKKNLADTHASIRSHSAVELARLKPTQADLSTLLAPPRTFMPLWRCLLISFFLYLFNKCYFHAKSGDTKILLNCADYTNCVVYTLNLKFWQGCKLLCLTWLMMSLVGISTSHWCQRPDM